MKRLLLFGLGLGLLLLGAGAAQTVDAASRQAPLLTPTATATPTATPTGEPELAILQYVLAQNPGWNCQGLSGTPGHRQLNGCHPFGYFSHPTDGYVDNYGSAGAASAAWQTRRAQAQSYPIFADESYGGYPGYHAGDTNYPYAHYENYFWGDVWVMGAVSSDDTQFRGSPYMAGAIFQAAQALGYLGTPTPAVTGTATPLTTRTISPTATSGPPVCEVFTTGASAGCTPPATYAYSFGFSNITCALTGNVTVSFAVAPTDQGPWTVYDAQYYPNHVFPVGGSSLSGTFTEPNIPAPNQWFEVWISGVPGPPYTGVQPHPLCTSATGTPTPATATPTAPSVPGTRTATPTPALSPVLTPTPTSTVPATSTPALSPVLTPTPTSTAPATACPISYSDVPPGNPFYSYIHCLACRGIVGGYADGTFHPYANLTRGQIAKIVAGAAAYNDPIPPTQQTFAEVPPTQPFWLPIEQMAGHGLISGYTCGGPGEGCDGQRRPYFRPNAPVTRGQIAKIDAGARGYGAPIPPTQQTFADVPPSHPFWLPIEQAALHEVISGYGCGGPGEQCDDGRRPYYRAGASVTRGQAAKIIANTFFPGCAPLMR